MSGKETPVSNPLSNPLGFIDGLFSGALEGEGKLQGDEYGEHETYEALLQSPEFVEKIPYLNRASLGRIPHNALVRYRGLVQDVYNEEYFTGVYEQKIVKKGSGELISSKLVLSKYRDIIDEAPSVAADGAEVTLSDFESPKCRIMQRQSLLCVPIPGESEWVHSYCGNDESVAPLVVPSSSSSGSSKKNKRASESACAHEEISPPKAQNSSADTDMGGNDENCMPPAAPENLAAGSGPGSASKKVTFSGVSSYEEEGGPANDTPRPIDHPSFYATQDAARGNLCCLAKVYDSAEGEAGLRLNDMVEVVGVFSLESADEDVTASSSPLMAGSQAEADLLMEEEGGDAKQWPASIAPRVHVLAYRRVGGSFPLLHTHTQPQPQPQPQPGSAWAAAQKAKVGTAETAMPVSVGAPRMGAFCVASASAPGALMDTEAVLASRKAILAALTGALGGDALAAEYCLLNSLSRVLGRHDDAVLGALPLVLGVAPGVQPAVATGYQQALLGVLRGFMPRATLLSADLSSLNTTCFAPQKDYERNLLLPSPLQLGEGTALLVDETGMAEGALTPTGVQSAKALAGVVQRQVLPAKFAFCDVQVRTDLPVTVFARSSGEGGCRSLFDPDGQAVRVPLRPTPAAAPAPGSGSGSGAGSPSPSLSGEGSAEGQADAASMDVEPEEEEDASEIKIKSGSAEERQRHALYWACARLAEATMGEALIRRAEADFISARASASSSSSSSGEARMVDQADFSRWLTVARLLAASEGCAQMQERHWAGMRAMESAREERLR